MFSEKRIEIKKRSLRLDRMTNQEFYNRMDKIREEIAELDPIMIWACKPKEGLDYYYLPEEDGGGVVWYGDFKTFRGGKK